MSNQQPSPHRTPSPGSAQQLARKQGLARISAVTFGLGAASLLGAVAVAVTLPGSTSALSANAATVAPTTSASTSTGTNDDSSSDDGSSDDGSQSQSQSQPQATLAPSTLAPTTTNVPPVATSGAS